SFLYQMLGVPSLLVMVMVIGFLLAFRGRRVLFAVPVLALALVPPVVDLYHGASWAYPGLRGWFGPLAYEYGRWWFWAGSGINLTLALLPGAVVARYVPRVPRPGQLGAIAFLIPIGWVAAWYGVLFSSSTGQISAFAAGLFVAAFALGAGMGVERPLWAWFLVGAGLWAVGASGFFEGQQGVVALACLGLGVVSHPLGEVVGRQRFGRSQPALS
ncbi:MAG: hypothetical protein ACRDVM_09845, partial [Acidimicrobiia bacterium]